MALRSATFLALVGALSELSVQLLRHFAPDVFRELQGSLTYVFVFAPFTYLIFFAVLFLKQEAKKS